MRNFALYFTSLALLLAVFAAGGYAPSSPGQARTFIPTVGSFGIPALAEPLAVCFAPGTSESYMREWEQRIRDRHAADYFIAGRWSSTATNPTTGSDGTGCTLTYSFIPDGTDIDGQPSQLFSNLRSKFGSDSAWQAMFARVFAEWAAVSGLRYVHETNDDGATFVDSPGELGVRGDVRIGSVPIDGASGVLAYDYYPNYGDMVLDASELWGNRSSDYIFFRNIVAHEHGHGWGLAHVCPTNGTKLLEPYYSSGFDGPQHDDIRAVQENYGDTYQPNYTAATAYRIGLLGHDTTLAHASLRSASDFDYFKFAIPAGKGFTLSLVPEGRTYLNGPQNDDGSCDPGTMINSLNVQNLDLFLLNSTGQTTLAQANSHPAGEIEQVYRYTVATPGDSFIAKVSGGAMSGQQLYSLQFDIYNLADPYLSLAPLDFDSTNIGTPVTLSPQLINPWSSPIQVTSISTTAPFTVSPSGPLTIPVGGNVNLSVVFPGATPGDFYGTLSVVHSGPGGTLTTGLHATAITTGLVFEYGVSTDFGNVPLNTTDSTRLVLRALGNAPITILSITTTAPFSAVFNGPVTLFPSQAYLPWVHFHPTQLGAANALLIFTHTGMTSPDTAYLSGFGVPALSVSDSRTLPATYSLAQNYPNPFNPSTEFRFDLPEAAQVKLQVFNTLGQLVATLTDEMRPAGSYTLSWNGRADNGVSLASGLYLCRIKTAKFTASRKMLLLK